jgi:hypothetical protein
MNIELTFAEAMMLFYFTLALIILTFCVVQCVNDYRAERRMRRMMRARRRALHRSYY